ncbi:MAG: response regulator [Candidatus Acidiferrales bacterium]
MSDATNFPLSDANDGGGIPGGMFGASDPNENSSDGGDGAANTGASTSQPCDQPQLNSISSAAAETARALSCESGTHATEGKRAPQNDRRRKRRALISAPVRVRSVHTTQGGPDEIATTIDVSRGGILFETQSNLFGRGMDVAITFPYCDAPGALQAEQQARVARVRELPDGRFAVAIAIRAGAGEDLVDACGRKLDENPVRVCHVPESAFTKLLVLAVDADDVVRDTLRNYLTNEGYDVIAVKTCAEARDALDILAPALVIAEVEGEGLPGFELCAYVKATPKLKKIPVLLTTSNGYPTDYSNAHSLGAVVCMAKPYKQERLGHVVRLLAPPPQVLAENAPAPRAPDPSRRTFSAPKSAPRNGSSRRSRFFPFR